MTRMLILTVLFGLAAGTVEAQSACQPALASVSVASASYAEASAAPFGGRVFVYAPAIQSGGSAGFQPFQIWIVEGIYGRPFLQPSGPLNESSFAKLRQTSNVRATPVNVSKGNGADAGTVQIAGSQTRVQVTKVSAGKTGGAQVRLCR